ncbi:probable serine/threonine-protein kinase kinX [Calliphora vicina]|uniref:probable serine/threonine-protein kinase kinX n=1 Tax=Calliphora vicina TaxID=7373 RepID=UPI00325ABC75
MTQVIKQNMNIRKRRIMEALKEVETEAPTISLDSAATKKDEPTTSDGLKKKLISTNIRDRTSLDALKISTEEEHILDELMQQLISSDDEDEPTPDDLNKMVIATDKHTPNQLKNEQISTEEPTQYDVHNVEISTEEPTQYEVHTVEISTEEPTPDEVHNVEPSPKEPTPDEVHNVEISTEEPTQFDVHNVEISTDEPTQYDVHNVEISTEESTPEVVKNEPISTGDPTPDVHNNEPTSTDQPTLAVVKNEPTLADEPKLDDLEKQKLLKEREQQIKLLVEQSKLVDEKLTMLENWERSKRDGLEKLVVVVEKLQDLEDEAEKLEDFLWSHNIEVDEKDYEIYFNKCESENPIDKSAKSLRPETPKPEEQQIKRIKISATSTPISRKPKQSDIADKFEANEDGMVVIGPNGTMISKTALQAINWNLSGAALTRKILMEVFGRETLAFHTLTGKPSPAFMDCDKPMKNQLEPLKVADIIHLVMEHTQLTAKEVRNAITTKCADENKMFRQREKKRQNAALKLKK